MIAKPLFSNLIQHVFARVIAASVVASFLFNLWREGGFLGSKPEQAYFVKCDAENNPQSGIDQGVVNILVGFAPLYPAEFVLIQIQQLAGQSGGGAAPQPPG